MLSRSRLTMAAPLVLLTACAGGPQGFDLDLRDRLGNAFDTSQAVETRVAARPAPDARGIISYPGYQVAIARRGDTPRAVAQRVGLPAEEVAGFNGVPADVTLRPGEVVALPRRVTGSAPASASAPATGAIRPPQPITATSLEERADAAISRAETSSPRTPAPAAAPVQSGPEPQRHKVARGETAFSIARRYGVPVQALADWNGLDSNMMVREGAYLLIPVAQPVVPQAAAPETSQPGQGTVAPPPPSAAAPLPDEEATQAPPEEMPPSAALSGQTTAASASDARLVYPVQGAVVRAFSKGNNDGIDIAAPAGTVVKAADAGTVAAITRDTDQVPILVLRHSGNLLTVYAGVTDITLTKGDSVARGQAIAKVRPGNPAALHFEVREGFESVDPVDFLE